MRNGFCRRSSIFRCATSGFVLIASAAEGRVLDVGIGSGLNLPFYGGQAREIFGLDPSPRLLARAQRQTQHMEIPFHLLEGSAECIPLADRSMDTIHDMDRL